MRKAVPVALVLIAGAAVILWFGSRLNSWVLGGLMGGLASLLLSIPISLALFAYFARQQDEHGQYPQMLRKHLRPRRPKPLPHEIETDYYDDEYALADGEISTVVEEHYQPPAANNGWLDEECGFPMPPARQLPPATSSRHPSDPSRVPQRKTAPIVRKTRVLEEEHRTRKTAVRRAAYPGMPSSQQTSVGSRFRSDALHTARLEAARHYTGEGDDISIEDSSESSMGPSARSERGRGLRADHWAPASFTEDVHRPLQRRAPYTYEDDEVRQEMSHYGETPPVRRSSRYVRGRKNQDQAP